jgi:hypothetical protein
VDAFVDVLDRTLITLISMAMAPGGFEATALTALVEQKR